MAGDNKDVPKQKTRKRKADEKEVEDLVVSQPSPGQSKQKTKEMKIHSKVIAVNKNNNKRGENVKSELVPKINVKMSRKLEPKETQVKASSTQGSAIDAVQRSLIKQFDAVDQEFNYTADDIVNIAVDADEENEFMDPEKHIEYEEIITIPEEMNLQQGESSNVGIGRIERQSNAGSEVVLRNTEEDFESLRGIPAFESFLQKIFGRR